jgi:serine phosphatase RsbU (regulator of sigma subunit)
VVVEHTRGAPEPPAASRGVAEQVFDALTAQPTVGFALLDADLRYVAVNERLAQINELPVEEHLGRRLHEVLPHVAPLAEGPFREVLRTGVPLPDLQFAGTLPTATGVRRHWRESVYPVRDESGRPVALAVLVWDVTERVAHEEERERLLAAEREAARRALVAAERQALLQQLTAALAGAMTVGAVARIVVALAAEVMGAGAATLAECTTPDGDELRVLAVAGVAADVVRSGAVYRAVDMPLLAEVLRERRPVVLGSVAERDARFPDLVGVDSGQQVWVNLPLVASGALLGMASFGWPQPRLVDAGELELLESFATQCATALDRARLHEAERTARADAERARADAERARAEAELSRSRLDVLARASDLLSRSLDEQAVLDQLAALVVPDLADWLVVLLPDGRGRLVPRMSVHADPDWRPTPTEVAGEAVIPLASQVPAARVFTSGEQLYAPDVRPHLLVEGTPPAVGALADALSLSPGLLVPMLVRGRPIGVLSLVNTSGRADTLGADRELFGDLARRAGIALDNARLYGQRTRVAARLQETLLPERLPEVPGVEVAVRYTTAEEAVDVGGDFYDLVPVADGEHFVVVGDVSGRGVDAATITGVARHTLRALASEPSPVAGLERLARVLAASGDSERFVTAVAARLTHRDEGGLTVRLARAGHTHPVAVRAGAPAVVELLRSEGPLLGAVELLAAPIEEVTHVLRPGDALVLYTDGITESRRGDELFGEERLIDALAAAAGGSADALADAVLAAVDAFRTAPSEDDVALLVLRVTP